MHDDNTKVLEGWLRCHTSYSRMFRGCFLSSYYGFPMEYTRIIIIYKNKNKDIRYIYIARIMIVFPYKDARHRSIHRVCILLWSLWWYGAVLWQENYFLAIVSLRWVNINMPTNTIINLFLFITIKKRTICKINNRKEKWPYWVWPLVKLTVTR